MIVWVGDLCDSYTIRTELSFFPCQLRDDGNVTRRQTQYHVSQGETRTQPSAILAHIFFAIWC